MTDITRDFAWVLAQVLDGVKEHDLTDQFGIPEDECAKVMSLLAQARTYLAKPEPEGPTDEELLRVYGLAKRDYCYEGPIDDWPKRAERAATVHGLRAVLALGK